MELDEDKEVVPDAETMEFYRIGPPVPSILRKPGERSKRLEISRRVSFSKDVSEGSSESLHRRLRFNAAPSGRTLRKKQNISIIAFCSFSMVTLVGVFWGYIIHGIVHTEGVTPTPPLRSREYLKASAQEEVLRDLDDSDYAVPNLVFLTERPRRRRLRTPVVVLRRHPPPLVSQTPSLPTRRWNRTRSYRARRRSANVTTTTRRRRAKLTRKPVFQWRSKVLVSPVSTPETESTGGPPSAVEDEGASSLPPRHPEVVLTENNMGDENALFPGDGGSVEDNYVLGASDGSKGSDTSSLRGGLLDSHVTVEDTSGNDTALVGNDTEVTNLTGPVVDNNVTSLGNTSGAGAEGQQDLSHKSSADVYKDDQTSSAGVEEVISSNALLSDEGGQVEKGVGDHVVGNESSHSSYLVDEGTSSDTSATNVTTATMNLNATTQRPEVVVSEGVVNGTDTDYYD